MGLITLLTDFGVADTYVGQMKGAILSVAPSATLVDITHAVPAQDVFAGAFLLWTAVEAFPPGTLHLAVVDPGVGSSRRPIAIRSRRVDVFVGPDNGLLIPAVERLGGAELAVELSQPEFWRATRSPTFHGRDIFGPVVGHLASGIALDRLGSTITNLTPMELPKPHGLTGEVIHVDTYGNLITNLPKDSLPPNFEVAVNDRNVKNASFYAAVEPGELIALVGSAGLLEISARDGSARNITGASRGAPVIVVPT